MSELVVWKASLASTFCFFGNVNYVQIKNILFLSGHHKLITLKGLSYVSLPYLVLF